MLNNSFSSNNYFFILISWLQSKEKEYSLEMIKIGPESTVTLNTKEKREVICVMQGEGGLMINGKMYLLKLGDIIKIGSNTMRTIANIENNPLWVLSILYKF